MTRLPGEPLLSHDGPLLPLAKTPNWPAAAHASKTSSMNGSLEGSTVPHELLMTCGRSCGCGSSPLRSVGASIHSPEEIKLASLTQQPLVAIQLAPGATPISLLPPSSPTIVPMTWVP